uniref:Uncharacterized protein n=1 Tax=Opuntia streptacantha TaxID=393608 RepID=A0A7C8ZXC6_OPUST
MGANRNSAKLFIFESSTSSSLHLDEKSADKALSFSTSCSNKPTLASSDFASASVALSCNSTASFLVFVISSSLSTASFELVAEVNLLCKESASYFILESSSSNLLYSAESSADNCLSFSASFSKVSTLARRHFTSACAAVSCDSASSFFAFVLWSCRSTASFNSLIEAD